MLRWIWTFCLLIWLLPGFAQAQEVLRVDSQHMLLTALKKASVEGAKGLTIELAPGRYEAIKLHGLKATAQAPLTLRSADQAKPARLSGFSIKNARHVILENLVLDYRFAAGDPLHLRPFSIQDSAEVTLRGSLFDGDLVRGGAATDNGFATAQGLNVAGSSDIRVLNNEFRRFYRGMVLHTSRNLIVRGNDVHSIRSDGLNFAQVRDVVIENNHIHDFRLSLKSNDHADMIQFWTTKTTAPSRNITIHNNVLNSGQGWFTQSIFMRNEEVDNGRAGQDMFYRNIRITQNVVLNAHLHGITVGETNGLLIANNSVLRNARSEGKKDNPSLWTPKITVAQNAQNVRVTQNVTSRIDGDTGQSHWVVRDNLFVQDRARMEPGFYGQVFTKQALRDPTRISSFVPRPGGPLDRAGIGAARLFKRP